MLPGTGADTGVTYSRSYTYHVLYQHYFSRLFLVPGTVPGREAVASALPMGGPEHAFTSTSVRL